MPDAGSFSSLISCSLQATGSVLLMVLCGVFLTRSSRLSSSATKGLATIGKDLLLPALLLCKVPTSGLTASTLSIFWILPVACSFYLLLGSLLSLCLCRLLSVPPSSSSVVTACAAFPTSTGPVLALFSATLTALNKPDMEEDLAMGASAILIYTAFMNMYRWTLGWHLMAPVAVSESAALPMSRLDENNIPDDPPASPPAPAPAPSRFAQVKFFKLFEPPVLAAMLSIALALFSPIHPLLYDEDAPLRASVVGTWQKLGDAYVASALLILGSQLAYGPGGQSEAPWADRKKGLAIVVSVRLVLVPLITFLLALAVKDTTWWSEQLSFPLKLVLLIQSATPPAIANASMSKLRGCNEDATVFLLFWSYAVGTITVVLWLSAFMHIS